MTAGPGGMAVQGQTVDANGMVRRVAYGNVPPQQQYVMANGGQVQPGAHRGQGQQVQGLHSVLCGVFVAKECCAVRDVVLCFVKGVGVGEAIHDHCHDPSVVRPLLLAVTQSL